MKYYTLFNKRLNRPPPALSPVAVYLVGIGGDYLASPSVSSSRCVVLREGIFPYLHAVTVILIEFSKSMSRTPVHNVTILSQWLLVHLETLNFDNFN